jgi:hypothetical protein
MGENMDQPMGDHDEKGSRQGPKSPEQAKGPSGPEPRLLDQVRNVMRLHHYSIHTERSYADWIKRFINFHHMRSREDLANGAGRERRAGRGVYCKMLRISRFLGWKGRNKFFCGRRISRGSRRCEAKVGILCRADDSAELSEL